MLTELLEVYQFSICHHHPSQQFGCIWPVFQRVLPGSPIKALGKCYLKHTFRDMSMSWDERAEMKDGRTSSADQLHFKVAYIMPYSLCHYGLGLTGYSSSMCMFYRSDLHLSCIICPICKQRQITNPKINLVFIF